MRKWIMRNVAKRVFKNGLQLFVDMGDDYTSNSDDDDDNDHAITANKTNKGNAFAGLNLDSSSSSSDEDDEEESHQQDTLATSVTSDKKVEKSVGANSELQLENATRGHTDEDDDDLSIASVGEDIMEFSNLAGRITRHGSIIQSDVVETIQRHIIGGVVVETSQPTEIQRECWTTMLSERTRDRDVIAISKTGSGKTLAFLVPLLCGLTAMSSTPSHDHSEGMIMEQHCDTSFIFPRAIVLAPTRVLAQQIFQVATTMVESTPSLNGLKVSLILGGSAYHHQVKDLLTEKPDLIVATPGRLNSLCGRCVKEDDLAEMCIKLDQVCEVVVDEADMMLALGFEEDLSWFTQSVNAKSVMGYRLVLTSATWEKQTSASVSKFRTISTGEEPIFLVADGAGHVVTKNVTQIVQVLPHKGAPRLKALLALLLTALKKDINARMIVFCLHKAESRQIGKDLQAKGIPNVVLEGDMSQSARAAAMQAFRAGTKGRVLVATDVASRGLDVLNVSHVFNYSVGLSIEGYIHRCGRTGRAGRFGIAHTFVVRGDEKFTPELCTVLRQANQVIPDDLRIMADKELKRRQRKTTNVTTGEDDDSGDDVEEMRRENRAKQIRNNQERTKKGFNRR